MHLLYCYILFLDGNGKEKRYRGLEQIEVNLSADDTFEYDKINNVLSRKKRKAPLPAHFWTEANTEDEHHNIYNINVIAGRNGSGKTTAIHCMMDLLEALYSVAISPANNQIEDVTVKEAFRNRVLLIMEENGMLYLIDYYPMKFEVNGGTELVGFQNENPMVFCCRDWSDNFREHDETWKRIVSLLVKTKVIYYTNALNQQDFERNLGEDNKRKNDSFIYDGAIGSAIGTNVAEYFINEIYKQVLYVFNNQQIENRLKNQPKITGFTIPRSIYLRLRTEQYLDQYDNYGYVVSDTEAQKKEFAKEADEKQRENLTNMLGRLCVAAFQQNLGRSLNIDLMALAIKKTNVDWSFEQEQKYLIEEMYQQYLFYRTGFFLKGHRKSVTCMLVRPGNQLMTGSADGTLRLWDVEKKQYMISFEGHGADITCLVPLSLWYVISGSRDCTLRVWDYSTGDCLSVLTGHRDEITCVAVLSTKTGESVSRSKVVSGSKDGSLRIWNAFSGECLRVLKGHKGPVTCVLALSDGRVISGSEDATIRVWERAFGNCLSVLNGHKGRITCLKEYPDGKVVSASADATLIIWDISNKEKPVVLRGHSGPINCLAIMESGTIVSGSGDATVRVWDPVTQECIQVFKGHKRSVTCLTSFSDGIIASGSVDKTVYIWKAETGKRINEITGFDSEIKCIEATKNGCLACGLLNSDLYIWTNPLRLEDTHFAEELKKHCIDFITFIYKKRNDLFNLFTMKNSQTFALALENYDERSSVFTDFTMFIYKYILTCKPAGTLDFDWGLSSGEENMLRIFSTLFYVFYQDAVSQNHKNNKIHNKIYGVVHQRNMECNTVMLLMDEADLTLHPEWQRCLVETLSAFIPLIFPASCIKDIQLILTTHSPLILGDIPSENITYLYGGENHVVSNGAARISGETFGQNIHTILKENFFLNHGTVGAFAANKINGMAEHLITLRDHPLKEEQDFRLAQEEMKHIHQEIEIVAPGVLRAGLEQLYREAEANLNAKASPQRELDRLRHELQQLSKEDRQRLMNTLAEEDTLD